MTNDKEGLPRLIQAGMGVHVSSARLANATSRLGALGMVSGAGLRHVVVEEVRSGNPAVIAVANTFPVQRHVDELLAYAPGGAKHGHAVPIDVPDPFRSGLPRRLSIIAAYVEVKRAMMGHKGKVGINVMWKCALTALPSIYGAMLAGVDALLCGAGVPMELPSIVSQIRNGKDLAYLPLTGTGTHARLDISGDGTAAFLQTLPLPHMLPIISNYAFCRRLLDVWQKEYDGARPFGFVLENHAAGGHNAPPRNKTEFTETDDIEAYFDKVLALGLPIYVAGAFPEGGSRNDYLYWLGRGAYGIQVGSRFALSEESGMRRDLQERIIASTREGRGVETSMIMSPTGYPIKVMPVPGSVADPAIYEGRVRICNRLYLAQSHFETLPDGSVRETYICPAMPEKQFARLGGDPAETEGRVCLCNGLLSTAGFYNDIEPPILTAGLSVERVESIVPAREIVEEILTPEWVEGREKELAL
ncbi:MAG: hypothetical protein WCO52_01295 [bacterium]